MTASPIFVPLAGLDRVAWSPTRRREPVTIGVPLPVGAASSEADVRLVRPGGAMTPLQLRPLDYWPDRSIRWALIDFRVDVDSGIVGDYALRIDKGGANVIEPKGIEVSETSEGVRVTTGRATFGFSVGGAFPFSEVVADGARPIDAGQSGFRVERDGEVVRFQVSSVRVLDRGPLRAEIEAGGTSGGVSALPVEVSARIELFADTATARIALTIRNPRRAQHPSGQWPLGDPGSLLLQSAALVLQSAEPVRGVRCAAETGAPCADVALPFEIYQESSGGECWNGPVHKNRDGQVPLKFQGYRMRGGSETRAGLRASPVVAIDTAGGVIVVAVPQFWENFPRAITVDGSAIEIGLFPKQFPDLHELQGGEQKTHVVVVAFAEDAVSDPPLAWCHDGAILFPAPEWSCATGAVPFLIPTKQDPHAAYLALVDTALDPADGFVSKCERADEYGWRNYGDLVADHESALQPPDQPFVSHYNNQYDAIAGLVFQFLRTADIRWWRLIVDLARHVRDIDIYHTQEDKAAYNRGMFWHTLHYADAGTSTHRSYPRGRPDGGGPSSEHNYNTGLMLHYFMTGDRASRDAAIGLGRWVLDMDDGRLTVFRWLAGGATGLASGTGSMAYHGPGRGPANSILACLVAWRLSGDAAFAAKADELIKRCVHPNDDLEARQLHDVERRWYYTVFLQALGTYLQGKTERGEFDEMFDHAQASLLHYARWMAQHERPYLDRPEVLEYPNETWAAQDMRKAEVFVAAAVHAAGGERQVFVERARAFFDYSISALTSMPTHRFTRPTVLMLSNGLRVGWFERRQSELAQPMHKASKGYGAPPRPFEPQKTRAIRRAKWAIAVTATAIIFGVVAFLLM